MPERNPVVRVTIGDDHYDIDFSDLTAIDSKDFRREVGIALESVMANRVDIGIDAYAGLAWLARRKTERNLTFATVAAGVNFAMDIDINEVEAEAPEA